MMDDTTCWKPEKSGFFLDDFNELFFSADMKPPMRKKTGQFFLSRVR